MRVSDVDSLYEAFTGGLRQSLGRLPSRGIPRINALRDMSYGVRQFVVVDPGGNYIRIGQPIAAVPAPRAGEASRLERALIAAITLADSKDDAPAAVKVLETAMAADDTAPDAVQVRALILRADLAVRMGEPGGLERPSRRRERSSSAPKTERPSPMTSSGPATWTRCSRAGDRRAAGRAHVMLG